MNNKKSTVLKITAIVIGFILFATLTSWLAYKLVFEDKSDRNNNSSNIEKLQNNESREEMITKEALDAQSKAEKLVTEREFDEAIKFYSKSRDKYLELGDKNSANTIELQIKDAKQKKEIYNIGEVDDEPHEP